MDRRKFLRFLGLTPLAAAAVNAIPAQAENAPQGDFPLDAASEQKAIDEFRRRQEEFVKAIEDRWQTLIINGETTPGQLQRELLQARRAKLAVRSGLDAPREMWDDLAACLYASGDWSADQYRTYLQSVLADTEKYSNRWAWAQCHLDMLPPDDGVMV